MDDDSTFAVVIRFRRPTSRRRLLASASAKCRRCEALHKDTPAVMPKIKDAPCPSGYFASGDACKALH
jgi:hypothetical protein